MASECLFEILKLKIYMKLGDNMLRHVNSENISVTFASLYKI